jgi:hypothetical protein
MEEGEGERGSGKKKFLGFIKLGNGALFCFLKA